MTSSTAISILVGSLSVGLGWFLNEVSQLFRNRSENRRIKNRVLHDLLEMNFVLSKLDLKPIVDLMILEIQRHVPIQISFSEKEHLSDALHKMMLSKLEDDIIDELEDLDENYQNSIRELSKVDPVRAYYLRNKTRLFQNFDKIEDYIASVKNDFINEEANQNEEFGNILNPLITKQFSNEIENLRQDTLDLANSIGFQTKSKVHKILEKNKIVMTDEMSATIQPIIKQLLEQIETQHGQTEKRS